MKDCIYMTKYCMRVTSRTKPRKQHKTAMLKKPYQEMGKMANVTLLEGQSEHRSGVKAELAEN